MPEITTRWTLCWVEILRCVPLFNRDLLCEWGYWWLSSQLCATRKYGALVAGWGVCFWLECWGWSSAQDSFSSESAAVIFPGAWAWYLPYIESRLVILHLWAGPCFARLENWVSTGAYHISASSESIRQCVWSAMVGRHFGVLMLFMLDPCGLT